ncbi:MAG TPA: site-2 protease family protein [Planctomycetota bacterium]|nr:site-2 protease family protein [Planctomycetota bacterium]
MAPSPGPRFSFGVRVHPTFIHLLFLLLIASAWRGDDAATVGRLLAGFALTAAVLLAHEAAHALVARRYGIQVDEILLHPLGGMAKLLWRADDPALEVRVALAGPLTNLVLAGACALAQAATELDPGSFGAHLLELGVVVNLVLGLGNLLPAFPMDGGRVLRAALSIRRGRLVATRIAVRIGRRLALLIALAPFVLMAVAEVSAVVLVALPLLAATVFLLGEKERLTAEAQAFLSGERPPRRPPNDAPPRPDDAPPRFDDAERRAPPRDGGVIDASGSSRVIE